MRKKWSYGVYPRIQSECEKIGTKKTANTDTFHAMRMFSFIIERCSVSKKTFVIFRQSLVCFVAPHLVCLASVLKLSLLNKL